MSMKRLAVHAALSTYNGQYHGNYSSFFHPDKSGPHSSGGHHQQGLQTMRSNPAGSFHGNVNVLLGGAMLSVVITVVCFVCYCCHRTIKKRTTTMTSYRHRWMDTDPNMEIYSVEQCYETSGLFMDSDSGMMVGPPQMNSAAAPNQGPPPSYDSVVANDELFARRLAYRKYSQHELEETDELMASEHNPNPSRQPMSLPTNLTTTPTSPHLLLLPGTTSTPSSHHHHTHHPYSHQHYCPYMYVNPHQTYGHHLRQLPQLNHMTTTSSSSNNNSEEATTHNGNNLAIPEIEERRGGGMESGGGFRVEDDERSTVQLDVAESDSNENTAVEDSTPAAPSSTTTTSRTHPLTPPVVPVASEIDRPPTASGSVASPSVSGEAKEHDINNNINCNTPANPPPAPSSLTTPSAQSMADGEQILSPKQMVIFGRQQRRSCRQRDRDVVVVVEQSPAVPPSDDQQMLPYPGGSLALGCDCQDAIYSRNPPSSSSLMALGNNTMLASHLCQCQQMAQMSCSNALCHCTEEIMFRGPSSSSGGSSRNYYTADWRHIMEDNNNNIGHRLLRAGEGLSNSNALNADDTNNNNNNHNQYSGVGHYFSADVANRQSDRGAGAVRMRSPVAAAAPDDDDLANSNNNYINNNVIGRNASANRCEIDIDIENNDLAIASTLQTSPDANNNNNNRRAECAGNGEDEEEEDSRAGVPPRPPIRTTSKYPNNRRTMPDDHHHESASDLNNNNSSSGGRIGGRTGSNEFGVACGVDVERAVGAVVDYCDPLLCDGVIRMDMSKIIDQTGLPTYEAALRLESSGYV